MVKIAVIGGTGFENTLKGGRAVEVETEYGKPPPITISLVEDQEVALIPRHGAKHEIPPHRVNYRAEILGLKSLGVEKVIATNAAGAINQKYSPGDIVIPIDIVDFTKMRPATLHDNHPVTHVDVTEPYCPSLRKILIEASERNKERVWTDSVMVCTEGPRFETPAEIRMFRLLGCDIVGMTGAPEAFLAREAGLCYASICFVSNMAAGLQDRVGQKEVEEIALGLISTVSTILAESISRLGDAEPCTCRISPAAGA